MWNWNGIWEKVQINEKEGERKKKKEDYYSEAY